MCWVWGRWGRSQDGSTGLAALRGFTVCPNICFHYASSLLTSRVTQSYSAPQEVIPHSVSHSQLIYLQCLLFKENSKTGLALSHYAIRHLFRAKRSKKVTGSFCLLFFVLPFVSHSTQAKVWSWKR